MLSTIDRLSLIEEEKAIDIKQLVEKLEILINKLKEILIDLAQYKLIEYNEKTGKIKLPDWLTKMDKEIEELEPVTGTVILPRYQEIKIQDITIGNFKKRSHSKLA